MSAAGVRERERDREWDARSSYSTRDRDDARGTTTVRRYRYGGDDAASSRDDHRDDDRLHVDIRTSHRDRSREPDRDEVRRYEREVARGDYDRGYDRDYWRRDRDRDRERDRDDDEGWREVSITRDVARDPPRREDYELDRYTRSTEYYARPESRHDDRRSPQTIVIRNEAPQPIIIRDNPPARDREVIIRETRERSPSPKREESHEETKEEKLELIERKSEVSAAPSRKDQQEDDYYYQRTTRDVVHRNREDLEDRDYRRDTGSRESVANNARGRERDFEDEVHYRRVVEEDGSVRDSSPHHKRHLAEGALVGLAGAALLNNRGGKHEGRSRSRAASIGKYIGGAAIGTAGAELITRARSRHREDRERSRSVDRELERDRSRGRYDDRDRERERSNSPIHAGNWAKLGAVAAIGALAGYAATRGKGKSDDRRSRSRHRRSSYSRSRSHSRGRSASREDSARNPKHRNSVIAGAGLASAAAAGLWEHHRNKSKGREGRSKSRIRTGLPIAATGLAGAALAGLYENRKAKREKARADSRHRSVSPSPTRSRSMSRSGPMYADNRGHDDNLIEYGGGHIPPGHAYDRGDPAYENVRSRSLDSNGSSPRRLSRSRDRGYAAEGAAGAGMAGVAAHEATQRRRRKQQERERRRMEEEGADVPPPNNGYNFGPYGQAPPAAPQAPGQGEYPSHYYPPQENNYGPTQYTGQPQYGGHDYNYQAPQPAAAPPNPYGYQPPQQQSPYGDPNDHYGRPNNH